jgi:hypothetical protein
MLNIIKASAICAVLGVGALAGAPAQAGTLHIATGHHGGVRVVVRDHDGWRHRPGYRPVRFCTAERALYKAGRMGVRRARVNYQNRSVIGVRGHDHRGRIQLTFGRASNCPLIR